MRKIIVFIDQTKFGNLIPNYHELCNADGTNKINSEICAYVKCAPQFNLEFSPFNNFEVILADDEYARNGNFDSFTDIDFKILHHSKTLNDFNAKLIELESHSNFCGISNQSEAPNTLYNTIAQGIASSKLDFESIWNAIPDFDKKKAERELILKNAQRGTLAIEDITSEAYKLFVQKFLDDPKSNSKYTSDEFHCALKQLRTSLELIN